MTKDSGTSKTNKSRLRWASIIFAVVLIAGFVLGTLGGPLSPDLFASQPTEGQGEIVLTWRLWGGQEGSCDELVVVNDGRALASDCRTGHERVLGTTELTAAEQAQLDSWLENYGELKAGPAEGTNPTKRSLSMIFHGRGGQAITDEVFQAMNRFAEDLYDRASQPGA